MSLLRKVLDYQLSLTEKGKPLHKLHPLVSAGDTFLYEAPNVTQTGPHIRDAIDLKRWMSLVILALVPCILMAIWNTGLQSFVYSSGDYTLMNEYLSASYSFADYFAFVVKEDRYLTIIKLGVMAFVPVMLISYAVGGFWEALFAVVRKHDIAEGFLVTGMLYPLILPPTIPYWMVAVGVSVGVIFAKEVFGGTGMNIMNPALACRTFLYFAFPAKMSGDVWAGTNTSTVRESLIKMNKEANTGVYDGYTQASPLARFNVSPEIKRVHIDAIATNNLGRDVETIDTIEKHFESWNAVGQHHAQLGDLSHDQMRQFVTAPFSEGGLGLSSGSYEDAYQFTSLNFGFGNNIDGSFLFGNRIGSMGETSIIACLIGALILIYTGIGSWRTMVAMGLGAFLTASLFEYGSKFFGVDHGAWNPAIHSFPAYKHMLLGGLAFGMVFMATDPVSSPSMNSAKWVYGLLVGMISIIIRGINPAYPEGVMLAIITGNVLAPLLDYYAVRNFRRRRHVLA
jgi:Na+-transporting NADH:ubiquinone oxidoreductase subunit B